jgi:protein gp37
MNMNRTKIEYLDFTLNVLVGCYGAGCSVVSNCWARAMAKRRKNKCKLCYNFVPHIHRERLIQPLLRKKPARIGLNFSGETFDGAMHPDWQDEILQMVEKCPQHTFIILTKQPQNIPKWFDYEAPSNVWLGVSVNRKHDLWRIDALKKTMFNVKIVSFEPLYEYMGDIDLDGLQWVIIGAQTRPNLQPGSYWVRSLMNEAKRHNIPVFLKNNLGWPEKIQQFPPKSADKKLIGDKG